MARSEQFTVDRRQPDGGRCITIFDDPFAQPAASEERAAREALRTQIDKLERELSGLVARAFPHVAPHDAASESFSGPRLLSLAELERSRDRLALRIGEVRGEVAERGALERRSRALLERMKREPASYKFVRLPVADLGDGHCGVWEVRPRLGLIGMLAGWWHVKLSSGCP
jgi:hypothetical protein